MLARRGMMAKVIVSRKWQLFLPCDHPCTIIKALIGLEWSWLVALIGRKYNGKTMERQCRVGAMAGGRYFATFRDCAKRSARLAHIDQSLTNH